MGRKGHRNRDETPSTNWESERTLAAAEEEQAFEQGSDENVADTACLCGGREFLLEAFMQVIDGEMQKEPVELSRLTCPECAREYEAIAGESGRILRGDFLGFADLDED
jgi:hypothetical protein